MFSLQPSTFIPHICFLRTLLLCFFIYGPNLKTGGGGSDECIFDGLAIFWDPILLLWKLPRIQAWWLKTPEGSDGYRQCRSVSRHISILRSIERSMVWHVRTPFYLLVFPQRARQSGFSYVSLKALFLLCTIPEHLQKVTQSSDCCVD